MDLEVRLLCQLQSSGLQFSAGLPPRLPVGHFRLLLLSLDGSYSIYSFEPSRANFQLGIHSAARIMDGAAGLNAVPYKTHTEFPRGSWWQKVWAAGNSEPKLICIFCIGHTGSHLTQMVFDFHLF